MTKHRTEQKMTRANGRAVDLWSNMRNEAEVLECGIKVRKTVSSFSGNLHLLIWKPKAINPFINTLYKNESRADECVENIIGQYNRHNELKATRKQAKKIAV